MMIIKIKAFPDLISRVYWRFLAFPDRFRKRLPGQFALVSWHLTLFFPRKPAEKAVSWVPYYYVIGWKPGNGFPTFRVM